MAEKDERRQVVRGYFGTVESAGKDAFASGLALLSLSTSFDGGLSPRVDMRSSVLILSASVVLFFAAGFLGLAVVFLVALVAVWSSSAGLGNGDAATEKASNAETDTRKRARVSSLFMSMFLAVGAVYQMNIALNCRMQKQQYQGKHEIETVVQADGSAPCEQRGCEQEDNDQAGACPKAAPQADDPQHEGGKSHVNQGRYPGTHLEKHAVVQKSFDVVALKVHPTNRPDRAFVVVEIVFLAFLALVAVAIAANEHNTAAHQAGRQIDAGRIAVVADLHVPLFAWRWIAEDFDGRNGAGLLGAEGAQLRVYKGFGRHEGCVHELVLGEFVGKDGGLRHGRVSRLLQNAGKRLRIGVGDLERKRVEVKVLSRTVDANGCKRDFAQIVSRMIETVARHPCRTRRRNFILGEAIGNATALEN